MVFLQHITKGFQIIGHSSEDHFDTKIEFDLLHSVNLCFKWRQPYRGSDRGRPEGEIEWLPDWRADDGEAAGNTCVVLPHPQTRPHRHNQQALTLSQTAQSFAYFQSCQKLSAMYKQI